MAENQITIEKQLENQKNQFVSLQERSELRNVDRHEIIRAEVKAALNLLGGQPYLLTESRCVLHFVLELGLPRNVR